MTSVKKAIPKRSTIRLRNYYKKRKILSKISISSITLLANDLRYYAKVNFLNFEQHGLLDTGANVSCIGADLAQTDFSQFPGFNACKSVVKTADGASQKVLGWLDTNVNFKNKCHVMRLFIIPSIAHKLILGIDFWRTFNLMPEFFRTTDLVCSNQDIDKAANLSSLNPESMRSTVNDAEGDSLSLSDSQRQQLSAVVKLFPDFQEQGLGRTSLIHHSIDVGDAKPIKQRYYPVSPAVEKLMFAEVDRMLEQGVIEPSTSAWSSPMRLVIKPNKVRLCLDARKVNSVTKKDAYPLPSIDGIFARLPKAYIISKLDLKDAFWQIPVEESSRPITAFTIPGRPLYQFVTMPFGLCNAPQTMCRLIDEVIPPDLRHSVFGYLDDLIIVSEDFNTHLEVLIRVAAQFRKANMTLNIAKSHFCVTKVNYLGYVISQKGITTDPEKVSAITKWPVPQNLKQVRGFLGLAGWYRRFVENFSDIVTPITELLSTKKKFKWNPEANEAFEKLKTLLTSTPVLVNPNFEEKFFLHCDASDYAIGAVLIQLDEQGCERPIAFMSKKLNSAQRNYSVTEKECLAAVEAIKRFRCYLEMQEFEVITDHSSLLWLMRQSNLTGRLARWVFQLQGYKFTISHRKGKDNVVPDALSRVPVEEISALDLIAPVINLHSCHFHDPDYEELKTKITKNPGKYPDIKLVDSFVYYRTEHYSGEEAQERQSWKLWIPLNLREELISRCHDVPIAAHGGIGKTLDLLRRDFFWPGMVADVKKYINNCATCKITKAPNFTMKPPMGAQATTIRPFQRLYIDILGPYPRSKNGYIGLFIVLDHFSKFNWLFPLRKFTSRAIKDILENNIFHVYGVPEVIVSDNGSQFKALDLNAFLTAYGIDHTYTALYSPQSNASERVNRSVIAGIRAYMKSDHRCWDENISEINCALRNSYHQSIESSPYRSLFGFEMITHASSYSLLKNLNLLNEPTAQMNRDDKLELIRLNLRKHIKEAYERNKTQYDLRSKPRAFKVGQEVFRRNFAQSNAEKHFNAKFAPVFVKARVREKLGSHYYILEDLQGKLDGTYHSKDIRL